MTRTFIALGKAGDLLSVAPILQHEWVDSGQKQNLFVSRDYAELAERLSGINSIVFDGPFSDLQEALKQAKRKFSKTTCLQVYGAGMPFQRFTPSFQLDQWMRGGAEGGFLKWPLEINRTGKLDIPKGRLVLFADLSQSSPFPDKDELAALIKKTMPGHVLVRLSEMKLGNLTDFLPLYDAAELIVSIETAHLHLTRACQTPVIALVTDRPSRWHGSAWHPRYRMYCRYSDFQKRKVEIARAMIRVVEKSAEPERGPIKTSRPHGYNPSIIEHDGRTLTIFRWHNRNDWRTALALIDGAGEEHDIVFPDDFKDFSIEDGRLFHLRGRLMLSYTVATATNGQFKCVVGYGELVNNGGWKLAHHYQPKYAKNDWSSLEKNWVPFDYAGTLHFLYSSVPDQIVIEVQGDKVGKIYKSKAVMWEHGEIHGGCIVPTGDRLLRFFHSHTVSGSRDSWIYRIGAALMNPVPPFETVAVSKHAILVGNEKWTRCKHWKQNVVFPGGVLHHRSAGGVDDWQLACGFNDCESGLLKLIWNDLNIE